MVDGKIFWDKVVRNSDEFREYLRRFKRSNRSNLDDMQSFEELQSHYFAILHNNPLEIRYKIRNQVIEKLGANCVAEDFVMDTGKNCEVYRISTPENIVIYKKEIFKYNAWERMRDLHSKGPLAIANLIERLESSAFS